MLETLIYIFHFHDEDKDLVTGQYYLSLEVTIFQVYVTIYQYSPTVSVPVTSGQH